MQQLGGILASLEGISGCGKTYFMTKLQEELRDNRAIFINEVMSRSNAGIDREIIATLNYTGDRFFQMGLPLTETFLLLSLKMFDFETIISKALNMGRIVLEDRSIDTIAIYQSIILCANQPDKVLDTANEIYSLASMWRRPPDITFLIVDDFDVSIDRAQERSGRKFTNDELNLLRKAAHVYAEYANQHSARIVQLDRRLMTNSEIIHKIKLDILDMNEGSSI